MELDEEMVVTERVAIIMRDLMSGQRLTTQDVVNRTGIDRTGAYRMLVKIARVLPLAYEKGAWFMLSK